MFTRGFTPGQANVYLLGRLAWNPDADVESIAQDFAALNLGANNAEAAAMLAGHRRCMGRRVCGRDTSMLLEVDYGFQPFPTRLDGKGLSKQSLEEVIASNDRALKQVMKMEEAFAQTDPAKAPDPQRYETFKEGIEKTALYLKTFYLWRQCWWRDQADRDLEGKEKQANAEALRTDKARLMKLFDQWAQWAGRSWFLADHLPLRFAPSHSRRNSALLVPARRRQLHGSHR